MNVETAKVIVQFTCEFASHIRLLETASYPRIPWTFIGPMEKLLASVLPDSKLMFRSQWGYNYKVRAVSRFYQAALGTLPPTAFSDSVFAATPSMWYVVSLPMVERSNVMMHVILGHEAGHRMAEEFLANEDAARLQQEIRNEVGDGKWFDPDIDNHGPLFSLRAKTVLFERILEMRTRALEELISDLVGFTLFGPSLLFALREFSIDDVLDALPAPETDFYPPWRYRYRLVLDEYERDGYPAEVRVLNGSEVAIKVREATTAQIDALKALTAVNDDLRAIDGDSFATRTYALVRLALDPARAFVRRRLDGIRYRPDALAGRMEQLVRRIAIGVPPAETDAGVVDFRDVILAGWLCQLAKLPVPLTPDREWQLEDDLTLERLVQKALEIVDVSADYAAWRAATTV